jgi:hypothetical protein
MVKNTVFSPYFKKVLGRRVTLPYSQKSLALAHHITHHNEKNIYGAMPGCGFFGLQAKE